MSFSRRQFLRGGAGLGATAALAACGSSSAPAPQAPISAGPAPDLSSTPFKHSVASGDPTSSNIILWTRVTADPLQDSTVAWAIYDNPELAGTPVAAGSALSEAAHDYCVKVDAGGLSAGQTYYYQFNALGFASPVGRFRTLPTGTAEAIARLRIGVVSCSNFAHGYFHAYRSLVERNDVDFILHNGDYLYEYGDGEYGDTRLCEPPHEMIALPDYRMRHAQYKTDPDLQELHRQYAWINIWDDHETTDNSRKCTANNHTEGQPPDGEGNWYERKAQGIQAYFEWLPIRPVPEDVTTAGQLFDPIEGRTWRNFEIGELANLMMIDTRLWGRDDQASGAGFAASEVNDFQSADPMCGDTTAHRDMLGPDQESWLHGQLTGSSARWKLLGNQIMLGHWQVVQPLTSEDQGRFVNTDAWDGYPESQKRLYDVLDGTAGNDPVDNLVVMSGDIHSSWGMDLPRVSGTPDTNPTDDSPGYTSLGVEFIAPAISSPSLVALDDTQSSAISAANAHMKFIEFAHKGFVIVDITPERVVGEWWFQGLDADIDSPEYNGPAEFAKALETLDGRNVLTETAQTTPPENPPVLAPALAPPPAAQNA